MFQVAVAPVQWAMAKGHTIGKTVSYQMTTEAARLEIEDNEAQRLTIEEVDGPSAPKVQINNLDRLVNWSNESWVGGTTTGSTLSPSSGTSRLRGTVPPQWT